jgi:hypothetical protein
VSVLRLLELGRLAITDTTTAIVLAVLANITFKLGMLFLIGGRALFGPCFAAMTAVAAGLVIALLLV